MFQCRLLKFLHVTTHTSANVTNSFGSTLVSADIRTKLIISGKLIMWHLQFNFLILVIYKGHTIANAALSMSVFQNSRYIH